MRLTALRSAALAVVTLWSPGLERPPSRVVPKRDPTFVVHDSVLAQLTNVWSLALAPDGSLYLGDSRLPAVLNLESSGALRRIIGRSGEGPGEFGYVFKVGIYRDSLWVVDPAQLRVSLFPCHGSGVSTFRFGALARPEGSGGGPRALGFPGALLPDGTLLVHDNLHASDNPADGLREGRLLHTDRSLSVLDTVLRFSERHTSLVFTYEEGETHYYQPFSDDPVYAISSDGGVLVMTTRDAPRGPGEQQFTVSIWRDLRQSPVVRTITYLPRPLPDRAVDSVAQEMTHPMGSHGPPLPFGVDSIRRRLFRPAFYSPVEQMKVGRDGTVWLKVRFEDSPADAGDWMMLSRRGFPMMRASLPVTFRLLEVDGRTVYGAEGDPEDVPQVVRYRVTEDGR